MPLHWDPSHDADRYFAEQEPPPQPRCPQCHAFLPTQPDDHYWAEDREDEIVEHADGTWTRTGRTLVVSALGIGIWLCRRCGHQLEQEV